MINRIISTHLGQVDQVLLPSEVSSFFWRMSSYSISHIMGLSNTMTTAGTARGADSMGAKVLKHHQQFCVGAGHTQSICRAPTNHPQFKSKIRSDDEHYWTIIIATIFEFLCFLSLMTARMVIFSYWPPVIANLRRI